MEVEGNLLNTMKQNIEKLDGRINPKNDYQAQ
jgi:hypothetical protein